MKEPDIRKYAQLMKELDLTGLEITENDQKVRLERTAPAAGVQTAPVEIPTVSTPAEVENGDYISVKSPIVGLFYAAPAENAESYVSLGDSVQKGQTLCIVEAMKLMNELSAECDGVIEKICVTNGQSLPSILRREPCRWMAGSASVRNFPLLLREHKLCFQKS